MCVYVFCLNIHFVAGFDFKYMHFVFCYVCHVLHIPKSKISCVERKRICLRLRGLVIFLCVTFTL